MNINSIITEAHYHEGFLYVSYNGEFFKGCSRCGGTGHYSFNGMDSICYKCGNTSAKLGDSFENEAAAKKWCHERAVRRAQADRKREAVRLAKLAKRQAAWDDLAAAHPQVWALVSKAAGVDQWIADNSAEITSSTERDSFVLQLADKLWSFDERQYTARQIEVLQDKADKRVAKQAEAALTPAPTGRVVVTGEIVSTKVVEGDYGTAYKILVKDDQGFKVWVSLPKAQADTAIEDFETLPEWGPYLFGSACWFMGVETSNFIYAGVKGRRITFTATLEPSKDDVAFAFGSRPTKGAWL